MRKIILLQLLLCAGQWAMAQVPSYKWVSGSQKTNVVGNIQRTEPSPRGYSSAWADGNELWLYGGDGYDRDGLTSGTLNDVWKYDIDTKIWTWVQGSEKINQNYSLAHDRALSFDGYDDVILLDNVKPYDDDFTIESWVKLRKDQSEYAFFTGYEARANECCNSGGNYFLWGFRDGILEFINENASETRSSRAINDGEWHHVALSVQVDFEGDNEKVTQYIDGIESGSVSVDFDQELDLAPDSKFVTKIGRETDSFDGAVDNYRIWEFAKTAEQISQGMYDRLFGDENKLVVNYSFDQGIEGGDNSSEAILDFGIEDFAASASFENQDQVSDGVWITRGESGGIFNAKRESGFQGDGTSSPSPAGTLWAIGNTADITYNDYVTWVETHGGDPTNLIGVPMSLYLPDENKFFDVTFTEWTQGNGGGAGGGGGFNYTRKVVSPIPTFIKEDYTDPTLPENQARLTDNVWLTREGPDNFNLYNSFSETTPQIGQTSISPKGTLWARGKTKKLDVDDYVTWTEVLSNGQTDIINLPMSMYVPDENRYFDIVFTQWTIEYGIYFEGGFALNSLEIFKGDSPMIDFAKAANTDPTLEANQDRISDNVWITRGPTGDLYNAVTELNYDNGVFPSPSPEGTLWARGNSEDLEISDYTTLYEAHDPYDSPLPYLNTPMSLYIPAENRFFDITFTDWTREIGFGTDGVFAYSRKEIPVSVIEASTLLRTTFTKDDLVDSSLPENQDRISSTTWITRNSTGSIYNAAQESSDDSPNSPLGILWGQGSTDELNITDYGNWEAASNGGYPENVPLSMYLPNENRYFDVLFTQWTYSVEQGGSDGGGFSYVRKEVVKETPEWNELLDASTNQENAEMLNFTNRTISQLNGQIADVRIWNKARTQDEILETMYGVNGNEANLEAYYSFEEGVANADNTGVSSIVDYSSNNYAGEFNDIALTGTTSNYGENELINLAVFKNAGSYATGARSNDVVSLDLNNDGNLDLVVVNGDDHNISVLLGDGAGGFGAASYVSTDLYPSTIAMGKFNADANWDLAVSATGNATVTILLGDGAGGFTTSTLTGYNYPSAMVVGDVNKDGKSDIITSHGINNVAISYGDGLGGFTTPNDPNDIYDIGGVGGGQTVTEIVLGDFNNDTNMDLATANGDGNVSVLLSDGVDGFESPTKFAVNGDPRGIVVGDFNGDNELDLAVASYSTGYLSWLFGDGTGNFTIGGSVNTVSSSYGINTADYNGDGNSDLMIASENQSSTKLFLGNGLGDFKLQVINGFDYATSNIYSADFDNDGIVDLAATSFWDGRVSIQLGEDNGFASYSKSVNTLNLDGQSDFVQIDGINSYKQNFTWEAWVNTTEDGTIMSYSLAGLDSKWSEGGITLFVNYGQLYLDVYNAGGPGGYAHNIIADGNWHHVAAVVEMNYDADLDRVAIYVDGVELVNEAFWDLDEFINDDPSAGFVTKIGYTNVNFPPSTNASGGLQPGSNSNWVKGVVPDNIDSRYGAVALTTSDNSKFLFGGENGSGSLNDLVKYDDVENEWVTIYEVYPENPYGVYGISQTPSENNHPGARTYAKGWTDKDDNLWIFGGIGLDENGDNGRLNDLWKYDVVSGMWTWMSGASIINQSGNYGVKGVADVLNIPGARTNPATWSDDDNLYLFGGTGFDSQGDVSYLNDLWKFNLTTNQWTWIEGSELVRQKGKYGTKGEYSTSNYPGGRSSSLSWQDDNGSIWLFGGVGLGIHDAAQVTSDLWNYIPATGEWAWISGPNFTSNTGNYYEQGIASVDFNPGARASAVRWLDEDNNLWLFGGQKFGVYYNDLWKFNITTKEWTWVSGRSTTVDASENGEHGLIGQGKTQFPGSRTDGLTWTDNEGGFWVFGGDDDYNYDNGILNDFWTYDPSKESWIFKGGDIVIDVDLGNYGVKGLPQETNYPSARIQGVTWTGDDGKLWLFGGLTKKDNTTTAAYHNDLWTYDIGSGLFNWEGGSNQYNQQGVYGFRGVEGADRIPGARRGATSWKDHEGNFWMFGGDENNEWYNDLWKFNPVTKLWTWVSGNSSQDVPSFFGTKGVPSNTNVLGAKLFVNSWVDKYGDFWIFGGWGIDKNGRPGRMNDLWKYSPKEDVWIWVAGSNERFGTAEFGILGVEAIENTPSARISAASWVDESGYLWLKGGQSGDGQMSDLWRFNPDTNMWAWMGGAIEADTPSQYGVKDVTSTTNEIGSRLAQHSFVGKDKSLWVFGGLGMDTFGSDGTLDDLWKIEFIPGTPRLDGTIETLQHEITIAYDEAWSDQFEIQFGLDDTFASIEQNITGSDIDTLTISSLQPGTNYYYRIKGVNNQGSSDFSEPVPVLTLPATPSDMYVLDGSISNQSFTLSWTQVQGIADTYNLEISKDSTFTNNESLIVGYNPKAIQDNFTDTVRALQPGEKYYARIRSLNGAGFSPYSDIITVITQPATPTLPAVSVTSINQFTSSIKWGKIPEILDGYGVTVATDEAFTLPIVNYQPALVDKSENTLAINELEPGTNYYAQVLSYNISGWSQPSTTLPILTLPQTPLFSGDNYVTSITQTSAVVHWTEVSEILTGYHLEVSTDENFSNNIFMLPGYGKNNLPKVIDKLITNDTIKNLVSGQQYFVRARAFNASGDSPNSNIIRIETVPSAPNFNSISNISQNSASLSWNFPNGANSFLFDLSTNESFDSEGLTVVDLPVAVPFQILENLAPGTAYYARIQSVNERGSSGLMSPPDFGDTTFITIPATPFFDAPTLIEQNSVTLDWSDLLGADGYKVDVSEDGFQSFLTNYNNIQIADNTIEVVGLESGSNYQIRIRSFNQSGHSPYSTASELLTIPGAPSIEQPTIGQTKVSLNWSDLLGADGYKVDVSEDGFQTVLTNYNNIVIATNTIEVSGLEPGSNYQIRIRSFNQSGDSPYSATSEVLTIPGTPFIEEPTIGQTTVSLNWSDLLGADGYKVDVSDNGFQTFLPNYNGKPLSSNSAEISGLAEGQLYQIRVRSANVSGSSPNSIPLSVLTRPSTPIAREASSVSPSSFTANWDQSAGATFYTLEVSADGFTTFIHQEIYTLTNPIQMSGLSEGVIYMYRVRAGNSTGESPDSNVITVKAANTAQSLVISSVDYDSEFSGTSSSSSSLVIINLSGGQGNISVNLRHKRALSDNWSDSVEVEKNLDGAYQFEITNAMLDDVGVNFEVYAADELSNPTNLDNSIFRSFSDEDSGAIPIGVFGGGTGDWQIFSIPYELEDNLIETVFNEMGPFEYLSEWRLMHYDGAQYVDAGSGINKIDIGKGYWFNAVNEVEIQIGQGKVNTAKTFEMSLRQGWNQIGNPYNVPISWNSVRFSNFEDDNVEAIVQYNTETGSFVNGDVMSSFSGGFVWADNATSVVISIDEHNTGGRYESNDIGDSNVDNDQWILDLFIENNNVRNEVASVGMHPEAMISKDKFDRTVLPRFFNYLEMTTKHEDYFFPWFSKDIVPSREESSWLFELSSNYVDGATVLKWNNGSIQNTTRQLWLIDEESGNVINMNSISSYSFDMSSKHSFSVHLSKDASVLPIPFTLNMGDPYPNPTNELSTVSVLLPQGKESYEVELTIFDLQGQKVGTIASGSFVPGVYSFTTELSEFDNIKNGVYLYRLSVENSSIKPRYKKLVINK